MSEYDVNQQQKSMTPEEEHEAEWVFYAESLNNQVRGTPSLARIYAEEGVDISDATQGFKDPKTRQMTVALGKVCEAEGGHRRFAKMAALNKKGVKDPNKLVQMTEPKKSGGAPKVQITEQQRTNVRDTIRAGTNKPEDLLVNTFLDPSDPIWKVE